MIISDADRTEIENAIAAAERKTSGEIVAVIAASSGTYFYVPFLWASLVALAVPWPLIHWTWLPVQNIYIIQLGVFVLLATLLHYPPLRLALVPKAVKRETAHRRAVEQFLAQNLNTKPGHTGVLLFVSAAERYVEILADSAVHKLVPDSEWQGVVDDLTADIGRGDARPGLIRAVQRLGQHLAVYFPPGSNQENVLPNHLIILGH